MIFYLTENYSISKDIRQIFTILCHSLNIHVNMKIPVCLLCLLFFGSVRPPVQYHPGKSTEFQTLCKLGLCLIFTSPDLCAAHKLYSWAP